MKPKFRSRFSLGLSSIVLAFTASSAVYGATETFNTAGTTFNWICPSGVSSVDVECWGGGGAGGAGRKDLNTGTNTAQNGGGGGGGAYAKKVGISVTPGTSYTVTIPAVAVSGSAGTITNGAGRVNGSNVTFVGNSSATVTAAGGTGGANAYITGANATTAQGGGAGGTTAASIGDVGAVFAGGAGGAGTTGTSGSSGSGGGGGGRTAAGGAGTGVTASVSTAAATPLAGGAGGSTGGGAGGSGFGAGAVSTNFSAGGLGAVAGGGGGGGHNVGQNTRLGGDGGAGQVTITYTDPAINVKADNTTNLNLVGSWTTYLPNVRNIAEWNSTVTSANTTVLGANLALSGIKISNPVGLVTISAGNTLTLGSATQNFPAAIDIDMSAATQDLTVNAPVLLADTRSANVWDVNSGRTLTLGGAVTGTAVAVTKQGLGTATLSGLSSLVANNYTGTTTLSAGTLALTTTSPSFTGGLTFGTVASTLDLSSIASTATFAGALTVNTNSVTANTITLAASKTLTINGGLTMSNNVDGAETRLTMTGGGALVVNGASIIVGNNTTGSNISSEAHLNLAAIDSFTSTLSSSLTIQADGDNNGADPASLTLSNVANSITAPGLRVGNSSTGSVNRLWLGSGTNVIQTDLINLGAGTRDTGVIDFAGSGGSVTLRDVAGTGRVANVNLGVQSAQATGYTTANAIDFTGNTANVAIGTFATSLGAKTAANTNDLSFDAGTLDIKSINMAFAKGAGASTNRITIGGGTVRLGGSAAFSDAGTGVLTLATAGSGELIINGGTVTSTASMQEAVGAGTAAITLNGVGAILDMGGNNLTDLTTITYTDGNLKNLGTVNTGMTLAGTGSRVFDQDVGVSGTIQGNITGTSIGLTKQGLGTLSLAGANGFSGATLVSGGTLALSGSGAANSSSDITVSGSGAKLLQTSSAAVTPTLTLTQGTLTGSGTVNTVNVGAGSGGIISNNNGVAGAALTIGALTFNGSATVNTFSNSTAAPIVTTTMATTAGTVTINASNASWTIGVPYDLISYTGGSIGGAGFTGRFAVGTVFNTTARQAKTLLDSGTAVTLTIGADDSPVWSGVGTQIWTTATSGDNTGPNDWALKTSQTATNFWAGDNVEFNDTYNLGSGDVAVTNTTATITAGVAPLSTTFNNSVVAYTLGSSDSTGITSGSIIKNGTGNLTIGTANTYTGATAINAGTITLTGAGTLGSGSALTLGGGKLDLGTLTLAGAGTVGAVSVTAPAVSGDTILNGSLTGTSYAVSNTTGNAIISANLLVNGAAGLTKTGAGMVTLSGANTYTGTTAINAGNVTLSGSGTLGSSAALTLGGGQLDLGTLSRTVGAVSVTAPAASGDTILNGSLTGTSYAASNTTGTAVIAANLLVNGTAGFSKSGAGTTTLSGANTYTGNTTVNGGVLNITGGIAGNTTASTLAYGDTTGNTVVNLSGTVTAFKMTGANVAGAVSVFNQTAGSLTMVPTNGQDVQWVAKTGFGALNITGGTFNTGRFDLDAQAGTNAVGTVYVGGTGIFNNNVGDWLILARGGNNLAQLTVGPGGSLVRGAAVTAQLAITMDGTNSSGTLNIAGGTVDTGTRAIQFGFGTVGAGNQGFVNLAGGTLSVGLAVNETGTAGSTREYFNFAGGALKMNAALSAWIPATSITGHTSTSTVFGPITNDNNANAAFNTAIGTTSNFIGGLTVNTNNFATTFTNAFLAASGFGVTQANIGDVSLKAGNSGYIGAPAVTFSNPAAVGANPASGYAVISGGVVTGIIITNPGVYALNETPTITLSGGGGSIAAFAASALATANTSGGLAKIGAGTLTLSGANTYTGATAISVGTLAISSTGSLANSAISATNAGSTFAVTPLAAGSVNLGNALTTGAGASLNLGSGTIFSMVNALAGGTTNLVQGGTFAGNALTLNTATLNFELSGATADKLAVTGALATASVTGINTINLTPLAAPTAGTYDLITTANPAGGLDTGGTFAFVSGLTTGAVTFGGINYLVTLNNSANTESVTVGATSALTWTGQVLGNGVTDVDWTTGANTNWAMGITPVGFVNGNAVTFQDTNTVATGNVAAPSRAVTIQAGGVSPSSTTFDNSAVNYTVGGGAIAGSGALTKLGTGIVTLSGAITSTGTTTVNGGVLSTTGTFNNGAGTTTLGGAASTQGMLYVPSGTYSSSTLTVGNNATGIGSIVVAGGTVTATTATTTAGIILGNSTSNYGGIFLSSGSVTANRIDFALSNTNTTTTGVLRVTGGTLTSTEYIIPRSAKFEFTVTGGSVMHNAASQNIALAYDSGGRGTMTVAGGTVNNTGRNITIRQNGGTPNVSINLNGGNTITNSILKSNLAGTGVLNFNGGTLTAGATGQTLVNGANGLTAYVNGAFGAFSGGAVIDTAGLATNTITASLLAPTGNGVSGLSVGSAGSGYIGAPVVEIDGDGTGATAYAVVDLDPSSGTFGQVTSVVLTNPGIGYTATPTATLSGGGGSGAAVTVSGVAANTSGALTKNGVGTLTLTGTNTYTGTTTLSDGTLQLGNGTATGSLSTGSAISVGTGATFAINQSDTVAQGGDFSTSAITGLGGFTQAGTGTTVLNLANGYSGITSVNAGTLQLAFSLGVTSDILNASSALTMGGGTLQLTGTGTQTLAGLTTTAGTNSGILLGTNETVTFTTGAIVIGGSSSLNFNTAAGGANGATVGSGLIVLTSSGYTPGTAINSGFTVSDAGGFGLATVNGSDQVVRQTTGTTLLPATGALSATNYRVDNNAGGIAADGSSSLEVTASQSAGSITVDTTAANGVLTLNSGVVLSNNSWNFGGAGTNTYQITGNTSGAGLNSVAPNDTININNFNTGLITFASPILANGTNNVVIAGTGTTVFSATNTYTGTTTLTGGILNANSTDALGTGVASNTLIFNGGTLQAGGTVTSPATRTVSMTGNGTIDTNANAVNIAGIISGAGHLTKSGAGTLTLSSATTAYTGATTISAGTLVLSNTTAFASPTTVGASGTLQYSPTATSSQAGVGAISLLGTLTYAPATNSFQVLGTLAGNKIVTVSGGASIVNISPVGTFAASTGGLYLDGGIQGSSALTVNATKDGFGLVLRGNAFSTYNGTITVNGNPSTTPGTGSGMVIGFQVSSATLPLANLTINGTLELGDSNSGMGWALAATTGTSTSINALNGTGVIVANMETAASTRNLSVGNNGGTGSFSGVIANGTNNTLSFTKTGAGTQTLSGANTFSGDITVANGTLIGAGAANSPGVTVFGSRVNTRTITVNTGGTLQFNSGNVLGSNHIATTAPTLIINSGGVVTNGSTASNNALNNVQLNDGTLTSTTGHTSSTPPNLPVYGAWNLNGAVTSTGASTISTSDPTKGWIMLKVVGDKTTDFNVTSGTLTVSAPVVDNPVDSNIGSLSKSGAGAMVLSGVNTYTGNTTVNAGSLALADNAQLKFVTTATDGDSNSITGAGTLTIDGDFVIDTALTDASPLTTGSWLLVNASTLTETFSGTFTISGGGWTETANVWTKTVGSKKYTFTEANGTLVLSPAASYASWIDGFFPGVTDPLIIGAGADPDNDGIKNGVELVIGGNPATGMDTALLPTIELVTDPVSSPVIPAGNYLLFTYRRSDYSVTAGVTANCETDTDLTGTWTTAVNAVSSVVIQVDNDFTFPTFPAANTDRVRVYVPRGANISLFGRLDVQVP